MRACVDVPVKKVAVVFNDGTVAVNLYTGKDYLDYDRNPDKYSKYLSMIASTYEHLDIAIAKDKETGGYIICKQVAKDESICFHVDEVYRTDGGALRPFDDDRDIGKPVKKD